MLLAIRAEALVARAATSGSLCSSSRLRHRHLSSAAAAQHSVTNRAAQEDIAKGFYHDSYTSSTASPTPFSGDNFGAFDDFGGFQQHGPHSTSHSSADWLSEADKNVFDPPVNPSVNSTNIWDSFNVSDFDPHPQPHTTHSSTTEFTVSQYSQPHHHYTTSQPFGQPSPAPTFAHLPQSRPQSQAPAASEDFSSVSQFDGFQFDSLAPPKPRPQSHSNSTNSSRLSRPPTFQFRDPREFDYSVKYKSRRVSGENQSDVASSVKLDIHRFNEVDSIFKERRKRVDYSTLPRTTETRTSSYRHRDRRESSTPLAPELQRKVREERQLVRQQAEKAALEDALNAKDVSASTISRVETAAEAAAAKKKAEKRAERRKATITVSLPVATTVRGLSQLFAKKTEEVVSALATLGYEKLRKPTHIVRQKIASALADHFSIPIELESRAVDDVYPRNALSDKAKIRSPLVCVMGHVDHGKTTLIDCVRKTTQAATEHGGITQKIGAFAVKAPSGATLTIFDTPGHEAFSMMRARGASLVDVVILVVAADDGVMPQTVESIRMVKAANVPFVVAITKCDLRDAKPDLVRQQLMEHGIYSEGDSGSDGIIIEEVSGKTGQGVEDFLSLVHMRGELEEPMAEFDGPAEAVVIESAVDKRNGILSNVLVRSGELKVGDSFVIGNEYGKVKQLRDQNNKPIKSALPSTPVSIIGTRELPNIGDSLLVVENEKKARQVSEYRKEKVSRRNLKKQSLWESEDKFAEKDECKEFHTLLKADCKGSIEAVESFFSSLQAPNNEVSMSVVKSAIGAVTEGDVALAQSTGAIVHAFNVKVTPAAKKLAKQNGVEIRANNVIFHLMDDVTDFMSANLTAVFESKAVGRALVKKTFKGGKVAGCVVSEGSLLSRDGTGFRIMRDGEPIYEQEHAPFHSLHRFDKVVQEVAQGVECGVDVGGVVVEPGDVIECVERMKLERRVTTNIAEVCQTQWKSLFQSTHTRTHTVQSKAAAHEAEGASESAEEQRQEQRHAENGDENADSLSMEDKEALKKVGQEIAKSEARRRLSDILDESSSKHY